MRTQITAYLYADTKSWLRKYAKECGLKQSEIVRVLVEREVEVRWLKWALSVRDPAQGPTGPLPRLKNRLPSRWDDPPGKRPGRKPKRRRRSVAQA